MFASWESGWGLEWARALQESRGPLGDILAQALHFSGGTLFFLILLPIIYWSLHRQLGTRLLFALTFSFAIGVLLKEQFAAPRPFHIDPTLANLVEQTGYGFPSIHVIHAVCVWGYAALFLRRRWLLLAVAIYALAQCWARVYLGVHFPHDVIGGLLVGCVSLWLFLCALAYFPPRWQAWTDGQRLLATVAVAAPIGLFLLPGDDPTVVLGLWLGCGGGLLLRERLAGDGVAGNTGQKMARALLGLALLIGFFYALRALFGVISDEGTTAATLLRALRYALTVVLGFALLPRLFLALRLSPAVDR